MTVNVNHQHVIDLARLIQDEGELMAQFLDAEDAMLSLGIWRKVLSPWAQSACTNKDSLQALLICTIQQIDAQLNAQVNAVLHHCRFQKLEASWRGVNYLCTQVARYEGRASCKIKLLHLPWRDLSRDVLKAIEFDQSELFKLMYSNEFGMPGGEPFGLWVGDYAVSHIPKAETIGNDLVTLRALSHIAAAAFCPLIVTSEPAIFGVNHFSELASVRDVMSQFEQPEYIQWRALRQMEDARFLGIAAPNVLMRTRYRDDGSRSDDFMFNEHIHDGQQDYLWGNAAYCVAAVAIRAYLESGWFSQIRGLLPGLRHRGMVVDLPCEQFRHSRHVKVAKPSVNLQVGERLEKQLAESGFIPISTVPFTEHLALYSNASVSQPKDYGKKGVNVNARLSSMLQYMLCVSRFAHYLKVMSRDKVGAYETAESIERELQAWLRKYTTASDEASEEIRIRYPLHEAQIKVKEQLGKPGHYYSVIHLRPHFQLDQMVSSIRLITELSPSRMDLCQQS